MALMPKRVKHRKSQRGRIRGNATRGNTVVFGDWALQSLDAGHITGQTIEACRVAATQYVRGCCCEAGVGSVRAWWRDS
jgi:large subunit ribosomal protein L16